MHGISNQACQLVSEFKPWRHQQCSLETKTNWFSEDKNQGGSDEMLIHLESLSSTYIPTKRVSSFYFTSFIQLEIRTTPLICNHRLGDPSSHSKLLMLCLTLVKENSSQKLFQKCYLNICIWIWIICWVFLDYSSVMFSKCWESKC